MAQARWAQYAQEEGEQDRSSKVCAEAGRKGVRNIQQHPILSNEWLALVDSLKQLARLVQLEGRMPANTKVSEAVGRNPDSDGTLWDQEAHENAVRILVEEAKVNLCLRMMTEYKIWQVNAAAKAQAFQEAMQRSGQNEAQLEQKCRMFEESLGVLLEKAFQHVETLQLLDIPMLIDHCALIYNNAHLVPKPVDPSASKSQETLVTFYFSSLMKHAESLNNSELLPKAREVNLIFLAVKHVLESSDSKETLLLACEGFAALAANEDFQTSWQTFFTDPNSKSYFIGPSGLEKITGEVLESFPDKRRDLRPLLDFFKTLQRCL